LLWWAAAALLWTRCGARHAPTASHEMTERVFRNWCLRTDCLGRDTSDTIVHYDVEHIVGDVHGGAYAPDNYIMMPAALNRLKNDDALDYAYCAVVGLELCGRALAASVSQGRMAKADRRATIEAIVAGAPADTRRLRRALEDSELRYPDGYDDVRRMGLKQMRADYKTDLQASAARQAELLLWQREACLEDDACGRRVLSGEMGWCDGERTKNCVWGSRQSYRDAVEAYAAAEASEADAWEL
jgi:hypothetical protein